MAIAPNFNVELADMMYKIYAQAEHEMMDKIARRIERGVTTEGWQEKKLAEILRHKEVMSRIIIKLDSEGPDALKDLMVSSYLNGMISAGQDIASDFTLRDIDGSFLKVKDSIEDPHGSAVIGGFGSINTTSLHTMVLAMQNKLHGAHAQIFRSSNDAYRNVAEEVLFRGVMGVDTRRQVMQNALNKFADRGITSFKDKAGRNWSMPQYAEMITRTGMAHAQIQGHVDAMKSMDQDLVIVSMHPAPSPLCIPHEHKIYSISGTDKRYKSLAWAMANGLFHPNCRHTINAYVEGLTEKPKGESDKTGYKIKERQHQMESTLRKWKNKQTVAVTPQAKLLASRKVAEWQQALRDFTNEHNLRREYWREKPDAASALKLSKVPELAKSQIKKKIVATTITAPAKTQIKKVATTTTAPVKTPKELYDEWVKSHYKLEPSKALVKKVVSGYEGVFDDIIRNRNTTKDEFFAASKNKISEIIAESKPTIRVGGDVLGMIADSGRFKNQHETGTSNGAFNPHGRRLAEKKLFGVPTEGVSDRDRPIYGFLDDKGGDGDVANWYGSIKVRIKQGNIKHRSTITFGDSLDTDMVGTKMWDPDPHVAINGVALSARKANDENLVGRGQTAYLEMQIHGGVTVDDIEGVDVSAQELKVRKLRTGSNAEYVKKLKSTLDKFKSKGIPVRIWEQDIGRGNHKNY